MLTYATLLTPSQVERVHQASLEILEQVGLQVHNPRARQIFSRCGCQVEAQTNTVKFPPEVVEEFRRMIPPKFTFYGREPKYDRVIPDDGPIVVTGSSAPNVIDPISGQERRARSDDIARIAYLVNELPGYDVFSISTLAEDAPPGLFTLARLYPAVKNCLKPVRGNAPDQHDAKQLLHLGGLIAGSDEAFKERPFITTHFCPVVSPLTMDVASTELLIFFAERGFPVYPSIVPNGGLTSPMSAAGTLVQGNAEFLAAAALMQMARPATPLIYSTLPTIADMRSGAYASGGIECGMLHMAFAQMARFYNLPSGGYIGLTNAKLNDAQSGYETGMSTVAGVLGGADMLNMAGLLDALKAFDYAKAVIDDEIALMLKRLKRGLEFDEQSMALEAIAKVGPGGTFMMEKTTLKWMKSACLLTRLADRDSRDTWLAKGGLDSHARGMQRARKLLARPNPAAFSAELDARIRAEFPDLVPGDAVLPESW
ncbi:MAG: trimethylamine methyltransferase family protein [Anaerolineales bacterium]|nr:trimethylamine methyltransferase family protein [Anaerolineales bacterium]